MDIGTAIGITNIGGTIGSIRMMQGVTGTRRRAGTATGITPAILTRGGVIGTIGAGNAISAHPNAQFFTYGKRQ